jgi:uncharacterized protein with NAD-binding domain and iron-sulfur cluster
MKSYINYNLTTTLKNSDDPLLKRPEYFKILEVLQNLERNQLLKTFHGNCIAATEIIQSMLSQVGIQSRAVEVQLLITRKSNPEEFLFIGFDGTDFPGQVDTHMVLITETPQPILIDVSIAHVLPADRCYLIESVKSTNNSLSEHQIENLSLVYQEKKNIRFPNIHQKTLITRIVDDQRVRNDLDRFKYLLTLSLTLTVINFILNSILLILKAIFP